MCRYCGAQAGADGVELVADHVVSVADGGDESMANLATACRSCNGGKGARSLKNAPSSKQVVARIRRRTSNLEEQAEAIKASIAAAAQVKQGIVNMKCAAYGIDSTPMEPSEDVVAQNLCCEFGADAVLSWYKAACSRNVPARRAIMYVCGIARKTRKEA